MPAITYREIPAEEAGIIRPLWEELNAHHGRCSTYFSDYYHRFTFEARTAALIRKTARGKIRIEVAEEEGIPVGYCIASVGVDRTGEIESILVTERFRNRGIGTKLLESALDWFDREGADPEIVMVAEGNEQALPFYREHGFFPRRVLLQRKKEPPSDRQESYRRQ